ncbi:MAG: hypothetical protein V7K98_25385 [Nostoc sp.]|uniref:hypothetical protein n=1 Tax=Nostoc sp. TaxID=1180 RepID=UPI002FF65CA2
MGAFVYISIGLVKALSSLTPLEKQGIGNWELGIGKSYQCPIPYSPCPKTARHKWRAVFHIYVST